MKYVVIDTDGKKKAVTVQSDNSGNTPPGGSAIPFTGTFLGKNPIDKFTGETRADWQICDGTNGTPDLRDRFILAASTTHAAGSTGGEATHTLSIDETPSHSHNITAGSGSGSNKVILYSNTTGSLQTFSPVASGGGAAHNNMPPYYALAYIMRIA